jgi:formylglycine-generating enzyme required for sulfatase activity
MNILAIGPHPDDTGLMSMLMRIISAIILFSFIPYGCREKNKPEPVGVVINSLGMRLLYISPGKFTMGSPSNEEKRDDDEICHEVKLTQGFYIGATEVTQAQWHAVMDEKVSDIVSGDLPITSISWRDAFEFCQRLSKKEGRAYHLPTEAQWEYACRSGTKTPFSFGETISTDQANYNGGFVYGRGQKGVHRKKLLPVGSFEPNAWGLYDMHGNAGEWCQDWYGDYPTPSVNDPVGPSKGALRVARGGSWNDLPEWCRSAFRVKVPPELGTPYLGFRVVSELSPLSPTKEVE